MIPADVPTLFENEPDTEQADIGALEGFISMIKHNFSPFKYADHAKLITDGLSCSPRYRLEEDCIQSSDQNQRTPLHTDTSLQYRDSPLASSLIQSPRASIARQLSDYRQIGSK